MLNTKKLLLFLLIILSPLAFFKEIEQYKTFQKGLKFMEEGNYQEARELFSKLRDEKSRFNENLSIYLSGENIEEAKHLEEMFNLGNYYFQNEEYEKAKAYYWEAMLMSDDFNIKKNYELSLKQIKEKKEQEQQNKQEESNEESSAENNKDSNEKNTENNRDNNQKEEQENSPMNNKIDQESQKNIEKENINENEELNKNIDEKLNKQELQKKEEKRIEELDKSIKQEDSHLEESSLKEIGNLYEEDINMNLDEIEKYLNILSNLEKRDLRNNHRAIRRGGRHD